MAKVTIPVSLDCDQVRGKILAYVEDEEKAACTECLEFEGAQLGIEMRGRISGHIHACDECAVAYASIIADRVFPVAIAPALAVSPVMTTPSWVIEYASKKGAILWKDVQDELQNTKKNLLEIKLRSKDLVIRVEDIMNGITSYLRMESFEPAVGLMDALGKVEVPDHRRTEKKINLLDSSLEDIGTLDGQIDKASVVTTAGEFRLAIRLPPGSEKLNGQTMLVVLTMQEGQRLIFDTKIQNGTARFEAKDLPKPKTDVNIPLEKISFFIKSL